jgi:hypothetical protein
MMNGVRIIVSPCPQIGPRTSGCPRCEHRREREGGRGERERVREGGREGGGGELDTKPRLGGQKVKRGEGGGRTGIGRKGGTGIGRKGEGGFELLSLSRIIKYTYISDMAGDEPARRGV